MRKSSDGGLDDESLSFRRRRRHTGLPASPPPASSPPPARPRLARPQPPPARSAGELRRRFSDLQLSSAPPLGAGWRAWLRFILARARVPTWLSLWWSARSPRARWGIAIAFCALALSWLSGIGGGAPLPDPEPEDLRRSADAETAALLTASRRLVRSQPGVRVRSQALRLELTYYALPEPTLLARASGQPQRGTDAEGGVWVRGRRCWMAQGNTEHRPDPLQLILPLAEQEVRFLSHSESEGRRILSFRARRLGSWGAGEGELVLRDDGLPLSFRYRLPTGADVGFDISFGDYGPAPDFSPPC